MPKLPSLLFLILCGPVWGANVGPTSLPGGWRYNDLSRSPLLGLALGGARATLTLENAEGQTVATVRVYRTKAQRTPWPNDPAAWTTRLVGHHRVVVKTPARLDHRDGVRTYLIETQSDGDAGLQLYTTLFATEVVEAGRTHLVLFSFEDTRDVYLANRPAVHALLAGLKPLPL